MKKVLILLGIFLSLSMISTAEPLPVNEITVINPVEKIVGAQYDNYVPYQTRAHSLMMGESSHPLMTKDAGNIFVIYMIPHHEGAIITSEGILKFTDNPKVKALAESIITAQTKEVKEMQTLLASGELRGNDVPQFKQDMMNIMKDMMKNMTTSPDSLKGKEATVLYLTNMIYHHEGAVQMAQAYLKVGKNEELKKMCNDIVSSQNAQIKEMQGMLQEMGAPVPKV